MKQFLYDIFITGLSGWIFVAAAAILGGGLMMMRRQKTSQKNIKADYVAGCDINLNSKSSSTSTGKRSGSTVQENITAKSVAGGDINKGEP